MRIAGLAFFGVLIFSLGLAGAQNIAGRDVNHEILRLEHELSESQTELKKLLESPAEELKESWNVHRRAELTARISSAQAELKDWQEFCDPDLVTYENIFKKTKMAVDLMSHHIKTEMVNDEFYYNTRKKTITDLVNSVKTLRKKVAANGDAEVFQNMLRSFYACRQWRLTHHDEL